MGSPSPGRGYRARSNGGGSGGRHSRRVSRSVGGGGVGSRGGHYYGESDEDSYVDEEVGVYSVCVCVLCV
jgi:hypothetical protein